MGCRSFSGGVEYTWAPQGGKTHDTSGAVCLDKNVTLDSCDVVTEARTSGVQDAKQAIAAIPAGALADGRAVATVFDVLPSMGDDGKR